MAKITLSLATTPAELGDAATQDDLEKYNELIEERNLVGEEVEEETWLALLDEATGMDLPVEIRICREGPATYEALGRLVACARDLPHAERLAQDYAYMYQWGVALCDTGSRIVDWGSEITDFDGYGRTIRLFWDDQSGVDPGWYAEVLGRRDEEERHIDDSMKIGFPVDLAKFSREDEDQVRAELLRAFPGATFRGCR